MSPKFWCDYARSRLSGEDVSLPRKNAVAAQAKGQCEITRGSKANMVVFERQARPFADGACPTFSIVSRRAILAFDDAVNQIPA
jgi:hypothetical protein